MTRASLPPSATRGRYDTIPLASRLRVLAFVCDAAGCTLWARRHIDKRVTRLSECTWDWRAAASAGLVQHTPLGELPRAEPLGYDRDHVTFWRASSLIVFKQRNMPPGTPHIPPCMHLARACT